MPYESSELKPGKQGRKNVKTSIRKRKRLLKRYTYEKNKMIVKQKKGKLSQEYKKYMGVIKAYLREEKTWRAENERLERELRRKGKGLISLSGESRSKISSSASDKKGSSSSGHSGSSDEYVRHGRVYQGKILKLGGRNHDKWDEKFLILDGYGIKWLTKNFFGSPVERKIPSGNITDVNIEESMHGASYVISLSTTKGAKGQAEKKYYFAFERKKSRDRWLKKFKTVAGILAFGGTRRTQRKNKKRTLRRSRY